MKVDVNRINHLIVTEQLEVAYKALLHYGKIITDANLNGTRHIMFDYLDAMYKVEKCGGEVTKINLVG